MSGGRCRLLRAALLVLLLPIALRTDARSYSDEQQVDEWREFQDFLEWKRAKEERRGAEGNGEEGEGFDTHYDPPPINEVALMGRYIVNQANWTGIATISTRRDIATFPFVNVISVSDGPLGDGSGIPYFYITPLDFTAQDIAKDNRATLMMTLAEGPYCESKSWDPMDPRCARIMLTGKVKTLKKGTSEYLVAKDAVFGRHPELRNLPANHNFFFAKLKIASIAVLDTFGGPKYVSVQDYLHPPTTNITEEFLRRFTTNNRQSGFADRVIWSDDGNAGSEIPVVHTL